MYVVNLIQREPAATVIAQIIIGHLINFKRHLRYTVYFILPEIFLDPLGIYFYTHLAIEDRTLPNREHK